MSELGPLMNIGLLIENGLDQNLARRTVKQFEDKCAEVRDLRLDNARLRDEAATTLERAVDRMGWPEINAFREELRKGQDYREDAGGYMMRAIRRLFGLPPPLTEVETYQQAARAMIAKAPSPLRQERDE